MTGWARRHRPTARFGEGREVSRIPTDPAVRRAAFRRLHEGGCFGMPNPWDVGSARFLQHLELPVVSAAIIVAELGDLSRFRTAPQLMGFLGLVPSESSSGESRRQGRITRTGNGHVRRILTEAAWAYRFRPGESYAIRVRSQGVSDAVRRIAWRAQERLCGRYRKLTARGKNRNRTVIAIARELAGFIWAIGHESKLLAQ